MNNRQKLVQQQFLNNEKTVIDRLQYIYDQSLTEINKKIRNLEFTIGDLTEEYDWLDDDDPKKEIIRSKIQSKIYQKQYQEALQQQVDGILKQMQTKQFLTISDYLDTCYEDGFIGTVFDMHGQKVPLMMPLDQTKMVRAIQLESKISKGLYTKLGEDVTTLKKRITAEVTRSISTGTSYAQCAKRLAGQTKIGYNKSVRIARTEGHRIQTTAAMDAMEQAKDRGADVVKQWDATLDDVTRESHMAVDGEIRELDEPFSNGLMFPGDPSGGAAEVVNCRCALLQRARWALDEDELQTLQDRAAYFGLDKSDQFNDFKKKYLKAVEEPEVIQQAYFHDVSATTTKLKRVMSDADYQAYMDMVQSNPDIAQLYDMGDYLSNVRYQSGDGWCGRNTLVFSYPKESYIANGMSKYHTVAHEYGHFFDTRKYDGLTFNEYQSVGMVIGRGRVIGDASASDQFLSAFRKDAKFIKANLADVKKYCSDHQYTSIGVQDAVDGLGLGRIWWGHGDRYYNRFYNDRIKSTQGYFDFSKEMKQLFTDLGFDASNQAKVKTISRQYETASELWANITSAVTTGGEELESLKKYFPEATNTFLEIVRKGAK